MHVCGLRYLRGEQEANNQIQTLGSGRPWLKLSGGHLQPPAPNLGFLRPESLGFELLPCSMHCLRQEACPTQCCKTPHSPSLWLEFWADPTVQPPVFSISGVTLVICVSLSSLY